MGEFQKHRQHFGDLSEGEKKEAIFNKNGDESLN
jgi:hypothetical protein